MAEVFCNPGKWNIVHTAPIGTAGFVSQGGIISLPDGGAVVIPKDLTIPGDIPVPQDLIDHRQLGYGNWYGVCNYSNFWLVAMQNGSGNAIYCSEECEIQKEAFLSHEEKE